MRHSEYGEGVAPALRWDTVEGAVSYTLIMENPDGRMPKPYVHWVAWNIPGDATTLAEALPTAPRLTDPGDLHQGRNSYGATGYDAPKPPPDAGTHPYHVQLFALDTRLDMAPGSDRDTVIEAMRGHVIGRARLIGTYAAPSAR